MRSIDLSEEEIHHLYRQIEIRGLHLLPLTSEHELIRIKERDFFFVVYLTGKMVFQESVGMGSLLDDILIPAQEVIVGTDEAGKGEWYGPLVVAGVVLIPEQALYLRKMGVGDSKNLSPFRISEIGRVIEQSAIEKEVNIYTPEIYNSLIEEFKKEKKTLNDLLAWAHGEVITALLTRVHEKGVYPHTVFIDKFDVGEASRGLDSLSSFDVRIVQKTGGESEIAVATASVLAKFTFEREFTTLNETYGVDLRNATPEDIPQDILPSVAKVHFKNVKKALIR
jgi:ribonuclease HIII